MEGEGVIAERVRETRPVRRWSDSMRGASDEL